jgi:hypothetical protein
MTTTQSREPTAEQIKAWMREAYNAVISSSVEYPIDFSVAHKLATHSYEKGIKAGREAALAELRAGGAELPVPAITLLGKKGRSTTQIPLTLYEAQEVRLYCDRRAAAAVPAGWKLVPVKDTQDMRETFWCVYDGDRSGFSKAYQAMVEDVPPPPEAAQ